MNRRNVLKAIGAVSIGAVVPQITRAEIQTTHRGLGFEAYPFRLPDLKYLYDAFGTRMSKDTLEIHHKTLHAGYVNNLNRVVANQPALHNTDLATLVGRIEMMPTSIQNDVRWFAGGHLNHALFWRWLIPGGSEMPFEVMRLFAKTGSITDLREDFIAKGVGVRGSGWVWLVLDGSGVRIATTTLQDNPLMNGMRPIFGVDVFEHAYFLDYKASRRVYLETVWDQMANWKAVWETVQAYDR
jgi:superoxide dismutase, Fe-Mn family